MACMLNICSFCMHTFAPGIFLHSHSHFSSCQTDLYKFVEWSIYCTAHMEGIFNYYYFNFKADLFFGSKSERVIKPVPFNRI